MYFEDTHLLSPAANTFKQKGYYTDHPDDTKEWFAYWDLQRDRCINGYTCSNGLEITGYHYWYLNFSRINLIPKKVQQSKSRNVNKQESFPHFWDSDYNWFWLAEIAEKGIPIAKYEKLGLYVDIPKGYIERGGQHLVCLKSRRKGYSFKAGSMLARNFHLFPNSKGYAFAFDEDYLKDDALMDKCWNNIYFNNKHCPWGQPLLNDRTLFKKAGYETMRNGIVVEDGFLSQVQAIAFHNNPDKSRGKDAKVINWEEAGKFKDLIKSWEIARNTTGQGDFVTGMMVAFGTGGSGGEDMAGLEELFRKPETYGVLPVYNKWEEGLENTYCGWFVPTYRNMEGFMDEDGNSDIEGAIERQEDKREKAKKKSQEAYVQAIAEEPFTPEEALMESNSNIFPIKALSEHKTAIRADRSLSSVGVKGKLFRYDGKVNFRVDNDLFAIDHYPHKKTENLEGCVVVYEKPYRVKEVIPENLYYIAVDPYAFDGSSDLTSLGACYVFKRANNFSQTFNELPVASYIGRPSRQNDFNNIIFMLAEMYNCKIGFENDRGNIIEYAREHKKLGLLEKEFEFDYKKDLYSSSVNRGYGVHMTNARKQQGLIYAKDWLEETIYVDKDGNKHQRYELIYDVGLIEEFIKFKDEGNFDRVSAIVVAMFYQRELISLNKKTEIQKENKRNFFKEVYHGVER